MERKEDKGSVLLGRYSERPATVTRVKDHAMSEY
jgi:hypothetical protein